VPQCPITRISSKLTVGACGSPDGAWRLRFRRGTANGRLFLAGRAERKGVEMYHSSDDCRAPLVESLDLVEKEQQARPGPRDVADDHCLAVTADPAGFTRVAHSGKEQLRQFALSSLHDDCPPRQVETQRITSIGN